MAQVISPGYVQGMNFICGFILSSPLTEGTSEADVFALVVGLMDDGSCLPGAIGRGNGGRGAAASNKYGFAGMYNQQMPKLNKLVYQVDAAATRRT